MPPVSELQVVGTELERVRDKIAVLFERDDKFYSTIEKRDVETISNRDMRIPLALRPGGKPGYFNPSGGDLGLGGGPTWDKAVINAVHIKEAFQWTKSAEWGTDSARKAVLNTVRDLLAKGMKEYRRTVEAYCMTAGDGVLATISTVATNTPVGFDTFTLNPTPDQFGAKLLRFGMDFNIYNAALTTNRTAGAEQTITFYDQVNKQIRCPTGTAGVIATDKIVASGLTSTPAVGLLGIPYHHNSASTGTWLGFDRSVTPEIRANRTQASGSLALPYPRLAVNKIGDRIGIEDGMKGTAWMHPAQVQAYEELGQLVSQIHKQAKDENLDLYFGSNDGNMQMAGASIKKSYLWDKTRIDFIIAEYWGRAELHSAGFYEVDGRKIFELRGDSGGVATSQVFYITCSFNLFVTNPAGCSYIDNLTPPSGY